MKNLKNLTQSELKEVIEEASFLLAVHNNVSGNQEIFYYVISLYLKKFSITSPPFGTIKKQLFYKKFLSVSDSVDSFIDKNFKKVTRVERSKLYNFFVRIIVSHIQNNTELSLSLKVVLNYFSYLPQLIDKSFPGYIESGLLSLILEKI